MVVWIEHPAIVYFNWKRSLRINELTYDNQHGETEEW